MTYQQTIDYLYSALPMFSRMGSAAYRKDLHNIRILCEKLGNPHSKFSTIHIAGTNGKGSVSHMIAAALHAAGKKTGLYTSPHLYDFRERIRINGNMVREKFVVDFVKKIKPVIDEIQPSFFEITVAMAFQYFFEEKVDVAVVEVGLGGRLDSTNIINADLSVITNIGWDHMNLLGNSLEEIAAEKAGIIKKGSWVVIGERQPESTPVFESVARKNEAALYFAEDLFVPVEHSWEEQLLSVRVREKEENKFHQFDLDLPGIYQRKNLCTVLAALEIYTQLERTTMLPYEKLKKVLREIKKRTGLQGRWEIIHTKPDVVLEVAHNREGIEQMLAHLAQLNFDNLHIITGMVKDKDVSAVLNILPKEATYYFTQSHIPRALDAATLKLEAGKAGLEGELFDDVNTALQTAISSAAQNDLIIVCGSIFLVAEVHR